MTWFAWRGLTRLTIIKREWRGPIRTRDDFYGNVTGRRGLFFSINYQQRVKPSDTRKKIEKNNVDPINAFQESRTEYLKYKEDYIDLKAPLIENMNEEFRKKFLGTSIEKRFKFETLKGHINYCYKLGITLPDQLDEKDWTQLLEYESLIGQYYYLDSLLYPDDPLKTLSEIKELDEYHGKSVITYPSDEELEEASVEYPKIHDILELIRSTADQISEEEGNSLSYITISKLKDLALQYSSSKFSIQNIKKDLDFIAFNNSIVERQLVKKSINSRKYTATSRNKYEYGLGGNTLFLRIQNSEMETHMKWKSLRTSYEYDNQPLVIDLAFLKTMDVRYIRSFVFSELPLTIQMNRMASKEHYSLHLVNFDEKNCLGCKLIRQKWPHYFQDSSDVIITEKSYIDLFDRQKLVYLSPDSRNDLMEYNHDDIYIVGGIIDPFSNEPLSLAQAKKDGIRHVRLPLSKTLGISHSLNVETVTAMMCDWKWSRDWFYSMRWTPTRIFKNRAKVLMKTPGGMNIVDKANVIHSALYCLSPVNDDRHKELSVKDYKDKFNKMVRPYGLSSDNMAPWRKRLNPEEIQKNEMKSSFFKSKPESYLKGRKTYSDHHDTEYLQSIPSSILESLKEKNKKRKD